MTCWIRQSTLEAGHYAHMPFTTRHPRHASQHGALVPQHIHQMYPGTTDGNSEGKNHDVHHRLDIAIAGRHVCHRIGSPGVGRFWSMDTSSYRRQHIYKSKPGNAWTHRGELKHWGAYQGYEQGKAKPWLVGHTVTQVFGKLQQEFMPTTSSQLILCNQFELRYTKVDELAPLQEERSSCHFRQKVIS